MYITFVFSFIRLCITQATCFIVWIVLHLHVGAFHSLLCGTVFIHRPIEPFSCLLMFGLWWTVVSWQSSLIFLIHATLRRSLCILISAAAYTMNYFERKRFRNNKQTSWTFRNILFTLKLFRTNWFHTRSILNEFSKTCVLRQCDNENI